LLKICERGSLPVALTLALTLALALVSMTVSANTPDPKSMASFYVETYGLVDAEQEPLVNNAVAVFDRVLQVADRKSNRNPGLRIVNSDGQPWAIALPDGYIILSRGALKVCFEGVSVDEGEASCATALVKPPLILCDSVSSPPTT